MEEITAAVEKLLSLYEGLVWRTAYTSAWRLLRRLLSSRHDGSLPRVEGAIALYVHIPFCRRPCKFCCFVRFPAEEYEHLIPRYYRLVAAEAEYVLTRIEARVVHVHMGGGTPALNPDALAELIDVIRGYAGRPQVTVELHPLNVLDEHCYSLLRSLRFDRVSVGVQSFHDEILARLGRVSHDARQAWEAAVRAAGMARTVNLDLVWGVPGETVQQALEDLEAAMKTGANQLTLYPLLGAARLRHPEAYRMYGVLVRRAWMEGWFNSSPWTLNATHNILEYIHEGVEYLGIGLSSISLLGARLYANTFNLERYEKLVERGRWSAVMHTVLAGYERLGYQLLDSIEWGAALYAELVSRLPLIRETSVFTLYLAGEARRAVYAALTRFRRAALARGV